ncbi:MAG: hypothetical protein JRJ42_04555 [Deltaproteobacteria bacterium]|nr:hypothetical protein [Deltaproteobacteria bacterium]
MDNFQFCIIKYKYHSDAGICRKIFQVKRMLTRRKPEIINQVAGGIITYGSTTGKQQHKTQQEKAKEVLLPYMWARTSLLLDLSLRFSDMPGVHGGKFVGHDLQRHYLDVPRLRRVAWLWEPITRRGDKPLKKTSPRYERNETEG